MKEYNCPDCTNIGDTCKNCFRYQNANKNKINYSNLEDLPDVCKECPNRPKDGNIKFCHCVLGVRQITY